MDVLNSIKEKLFFRSQDYLKNAFSEQSDHLASFSKVEEKLGINGDSLELFKLYTRRYFMSGYAGKLPPTSTAIPVIDKLVSEIDIKTKGLIEKKKIKDPSFIQRTSNLITSTYLRLMDDSGEAIHAVDNVVDKIREKREKDQKKPIDS